jgi:SAM-dependent methyltransferase
MGGLVSETGQSNGTNAPYALGHAEHELRRLTTQANLIDPITRRFFVEAGIVPGMRVLDVGSGVGDVAILLAELVGASGEVIGTDTSATALATARRRVAELGIANVSFQEGDPSELIFPAPFDAVAGRYVLQFMADPPAALKRIAAHVRSGGVVVFHELDWKGARSAPPASLYDRCCALCAETIGRLGAETSMGPKLHGAFVRAGLKPPVMRLEAVIGSGPADAEKVDLVADLVRTLLPDMERLDIVKRGEIDVETLSGNMLGEVASRGSVVIGRSEIGAWSRA